VYGSVTEAQEAVRAGEEVLGPGPDRDVYDALYDRYMTAPPALERFYRP